MNWLLVECYDFEMVHGTSTSGKCVQIVLCGRMLFWKSPFRIQSVTSIPKIVVLVLWVQIHWLWVRPITSTNKNKDMVDLAWDKEAVSKKTVAMKTISACTSGLGTVALYYSQSQHQYHYLLILGFEIEKCTGVPDFHTILTLVYNFVQYTGDDLARVPALLKNVNKVYPKIKIIAAVPKSLSISEASYNDTKIIPRDPS